MMKRLFVLLALFLWSAGLGAQQPRTPPAAKPLAFTHVTVIDATGAPPKNDLTVIITGDRITALGKAGEVKVPADAQVIDATGKFMIPGLWDVHAHLPTPDFLRLFIANGVTSVREMGGAGNLVTQWRREIKEGRMLGPRLTVAGVIVDGPKPVWPLSATVADEKQGKQIVLALKQRGMDFIKVYSLLPRAGYLALAAEAKVQGMPFAGHVPFSVSVEEAVNAGQQSIEHLDMLWLACSANEEEASEAIRAAINKPAATPGSVLAVVQAQAQRIGAGYNEEKAQALFALLAQKGVWITPTLVAQRAAGRLGDAAFTADARLKYMPAFLKQAWNPQVDFRFKNLSAEERANIGSAFQRLLEFVGALHRAGVPLLVGTDAQSPYCFHGFSLHDELGLLVKAGLTPLEALQSATRNAAKFAGQLATLGTVEPGKLADLVLLEADPLAEIGNTQKIAAVMVGGKLIDKAGLQKLLADAEAAAQAQ